MSNVPAYACLRPHCRARVRQWSGRGAWLKLTQHSKRYHAEEIKAAQKEYERRRQAGYFYALSPARAKEELGR